MPILNQILHSYAITFHINTIPSLTTINNNLNKTQEILYLWYGRPLMMVKAR